jgi:hypothetical protein
MDSTISSVVNSDIQTERINCSVHSYSYFIEGNLNNVSIIQEMCLIYNSLFNLNFTFTNSLNKNYSNLAIEELPVLNYGNLNIKRNYLNSFLKELVGLDKFCPVTCTKMDIEEIKFQIEIIEKNILSDLQLALNFFNYFQHYEKTKYLWKFVKFLYQPLVMLKSSFNERKLILEITRLVGISTKFEALEYMNRIFKKIENFLVLLGGEEYCKNLENRVINSIDILIYSAEKAVNRIISNNKLENFGLKSHKNIETLCGNLDTIILNKLPIKNSFKILQPEDFLHSKSNWTHEKYNFYTFKEYPETNYLVDKNRNKIRKSLMAIFYFGALLFLSTAFNNKNK